MRIRSFEFNLRELAGSMGDFGTLLPLAVGYIAVCRLNPAGLLVMMGVANIATGLIYELPMPIEPMKVLAVMAIAQRWSPSLVYASAFAMGIVWTLSAATGVMERVAKYTPRSVVRGIQVALGVLLGVEAIKLLSTWWLLGFISVAIALALRRNRYAPGALVLIAVGLVIMLAKGQLQALAGPGFTLPPITVFRPIQVWQSLVAAGFAQIPLTATNAVIATVALIHTYWPDRKVTERQLSLSMGAMNLVAPFFGGMPMCHGAGGLAGQYYFGARTGGTNIMEGAIEISLGVLLASSVAGLFTIFPSAIIGAMMLLVGFELVRFARDVKLDWDFAPLAVTVAGSLAANMAVGFACGLATNYVIEYAKKRMPGPDHL